jgi:hypothetical protein
MMIYTWNGGDGLTHYWDRYSLLCRIGDLGSGARPGAVVTCLFCLHAYAVRCW